MFIIYCSGVVVSEREEKEREVRFKKCDGCKL
jgi:Pyruvate/2-oxoacid:ferredoxin oxidoreductase delta subunit